MKRLSDGPFGPAGVPLDKLSDDELHQELVRRRRARNPNKPAVPRQTLRQYFANLELGVDASRSEVERAYHKLIERYHPDRHKDDPERHETARELSQSLTEAYSALLKHFESRTK